jgi:integrase
MNRKDAKSKEGATKPIEIKRGSIRVKIYSGTKSFTKDGQSYTYPQFSVCYYDGEARIRKRFPSLERAKEYAQNAADKLAQGQNAVLQLRSADATRYLDALELLKPLGVSLTVAITDYAEARKELKDATPLKYAAKFYAEKHPATLEKRTVEQVVDEMLKAKTGAKRSEVHLKDLEGRLTKFSEALPNYTLTGVTGAMIQQFLDNLRTSGRNKRSLSGRSKVNYLRHIGALFRFGIKRKYLPKDAIDELEAVEMPDVDNGEVEIFTPAEMREILTVARDELVPWLAIGGFAGLRSAEIARLDWRDINLQERHITIGAGKAKTGSRRIVPIADNLFAWLAPHEEEEGKVNQFASWWNEVAEIADDLNAARKEAGKKANFVWKHNGMRHSFCSYRLAVTSDVARVSHEAGNSPKMIHQHYKALVNEKQGKEWFAIMPDTKAGIIPMPKEATP